MPRTVIVSPASSQIRQLLEAARLPDFIASYFNSAHLASGHCEDAEVLLGAPDDLALLLPECEKVRWLQSSWAGVTPLVKAPQRGYTLTGVKSIFGPLMSEYVLGWLLGLERNILQRATAKRWAVSSDKSLVGKRVGILGTGSIGRHVAASCQHFGMHVRGLNTSGSDTENFNNCFAIAELAYFAEGLDYLVALLPDTTETTCMVNARLFQYLSEGAIFINAGRANCVDADALMAALVSGQLRAAVLDVLPQEPLPVEHPWWQVDNLYITSHTAAPTGIEAVTDIFCDNYRRFVAGDELLHKIDFDRGY